MPDPATLQVTIAFTNPTLSPEEREDAARALRQQLQDLDDVAIGRVPAPAPEGGKGLGFLMGWLTAGATPENGKKLLGFLGDRLIGQVIELEVEGNGKKLKVKASSCEELNAAIAAAERFIQG